MPVRPAAPAPLFVVVFRTGGTDNFTWRRTSAMSKAEAVDTAADVTRGGRPAFVERADVSESVGLPDTFEYGTDRVEPSYITGAPRVPVQHQWNAEECSCGSDTAICQGCGRPVCGAVCTWVPNVGNVEPACWWRYGLGHGGGSTMQRDLQR